MANVLHACLCIIFFVTLFCISPIFNQKPCEHFSDVTNKVRASLWGHCEWRGVRMTRLADDSADMPAGDNKVFCFRTNPLVTVIREILKSALSQRLPSAFQSLVYRRRSDLTNVATELYDFKKQTIFQKPCENRESLPNAFVKWGGCCHPVISETANFDLLVTSRSVFYF